MWRQAAARPTKKTTGLWRAGSCPATGIAAEPTADGPLSSQATSTRRDDLTNITIEASNSDEPTHNTPNPLDDRKQADLFPDQEADDENKATTSNGQPEYIGDSHPADVPPEAEGETVTVDEDAAREKAHICFADGEDADAYTAGPARFVVAADGVKYCVALLMTMDLSAKVKQAVQAQRNFVFARTVVMMEQGEKFIFAQQLEWEIDYFETQMSKLHEIDGDEAAAELERMRTQMEKLPLLLAHTQAGLAGLQARLNTQSENLHQIQANLTQCLEEAFIDAKLIEPAVQRAFPKMHEPEIEEEYEKLCNPGHEDDDLATTPPSPLDSNNCGDEHDRLKYGLAERTIVSEKGIVIAQQKRNHTTTQRKEGKVPPRLYRGCLSLRWSAIVTELTREVFDAQREMAEARLALAPTGIRFDDREDVHMGKAAEICGGKFEAKVIAAMSRLSSTSLCGFDEQVLRATELSTGFFEYEGC
ncbi:hypothetical protein B0A55_08042 [Friedmanniomyces simplex]|uniref:Uncharacterized protein n=1 Tax=Friedmanniomyces simplex TaxID=329884 RepID=A0A4U0XIL5_9PEZI|nr:hypothetical protein B0A55_08042 [Friedmanniomyces simplex]